MFLLLIHTPRIHNLTNPLYTAFNAILSAPHSLPTQHLIVFIIFLHLFTIFWICTTHVTLSSNHIPKNLKCFTLSSSWLSNFIFNSLPFFFHVKNIIFVLSTENLKPHLYDHSSTIAIASCNFLTIKPIFLPLFQIAPSSAKSDNPNPLSKSSNTSFIIIENNKGLTILPCGVQTFLNNCFLFSL